MQDNNNSSNPPAKAFSVTTASSPHLACLFPTVISQPCLHSLVPRLRLLIFLVKLFKIDTCGCFACMIYVCTPLVCLMPAGARGCWDSLKLEFRTVVSCPVDAGNWTKSSGRAASAFSHSSTHSPWTSLQELPSFLCCWLGQVNCWTLDLSTLQHKTHTCVYVLISPISPWLP